ncbi:MULTISPECIES: YwpF family protein [Sutcliffiella]|uniref:YwpF-like protein n=1 Tax=Sutcliffiella cohnii TaxID=33932 RepID=A0A223KV50_9BACI|nr:MULTISPECIES: YwpF family protein [Sutcliffiella]AST93369.1 hypothetical protein BC6307_19925 [Sutcliffiella cohnii]WBL14531.1 YwpF family protein [Sutcliffiella sp. NC1]
MKTFKLVSLALIEENKNRPIPLIDGLIINKELDEQWLVEAYVPKDNLVLFENLVNSEELIPIQTIISKPTNDPATFHARVKHISVMEEHISVLFDAQLFRRNNSFHVDLLSSLVGEGLAGDELLSQFITRSKDDTTKPQTAKS